jgi:exosome complex component RRP42
LTALVLAIRSAFADLKVPRTKKIGWEGTEHALEMGDGDLSGIKAALKLGKGGKGKVRRARGGDDWDLDLDGDGVELLQGREGLPVLVTLNLVCQVSIDRANLTVQVPGSEAVFIDATPQEDAACPDKAHLFFTAQGKLCGMRTEGTDGLSSARIRPLLLVRLILRVAGMASADGPGGATHSTRTDRISQLANTSMMARMAFSIYFNRRDG